MRDNLKKEKYSRQKVKCLVVCFKKKKYNGNNFMKVFSINEMKRREFNIFIN